MKRWQFILKQHHNIEVVDDTKVIIPNLIWDTVNHKQYDDTVTRTENGYIDS